MPACLSADDRCTLATAGRFQSRVDHMRRTARAATDLDEGVSRDQDFLYVLVDGFHEIVGFGLVTLFIVAGLGLKGPLFGKAAADSLPRPGPTLTPRPAPHADPHAEAGAPRRLRRLPPRCAVQILGSDTQPNPGEIYYFPKAFVKISRAQSHISVSDDGQHGQRPCSPTQSPRR